MHEHVDDRETVLLAAPRGYCAGVERAVEAVERALAKHGAPVYVRKQIVHNLHVVHDLEARARCSSRRSTRCPRGRSQCSRRTDPRRRCSTRPADASLELIDATCPLVTKVHVEARRFAADDRTIVLIGHAGHEEVEGTSGQAPDRTVLVQTEAEARRGRLPTDRPLAYLTQTTLSVDETSRDRPGAAGAVSAPQGPPREDICYATQNRQDAVKELVPQVDVLLVIGSKNSSNSNRLAEVAQERGVPGYLVDDETRGRSRRGSKAPRSSASRAGPARPSI